MNKTAAYSRWILNLSLGSVAFFIYIKYLPQTFVSQSLLFNPFAISLGEQQSVSPEILSMKKLAIESKINNYDLSEKMNDDIYIKIRSLEFLYPLRRAPVSIYIFAFDSERPKKNCITLGKERGVVLYECK